ncbi:hypothetical protein GIB67_033506 [Kingdonia uniflora]|uniref:Uncharacterized protein n=1 Tax=Kingdonia uniflora TaxID=39325 RepID=A0A7J7L675_9MAGN|nr:hypothetical protein GIB67_033506 [Kingdonia uniflora]
MMEGRGDGVIESSSTTGFRPSAALATFTSAIQGAAIGSLMGTLTPPDIASSFSIATDAQTMNSLKQAQAFSRGPLIQA